MCCDISIAFHNARRDPYSMNNLLGKLYEKIYGYSMQLFHLMYAFYAEYFSSLKIYEPTVLSQLTLLILMSSIDKAFGDAIQEYYYSFQYLSTPIVDDTTITKLYKMYNNICSK